MQELLPEVDAQTAGHEDSSCGRQHALPHDAGEKPAERRLRGHFRRQWGARIESPGSRKNSAETLLKLRTALLHHRSHRRRRARRALFPPNFQALARFLDARKQRRVLERRAPGGNDRSHAVPYHPDFAVAFEE